jgi:TPR repeat protein
LDTLLASCLLNFTLANYFILFFAANLSKLSRSVLRSDLPSMFEGTDFSLLRKEYIYLSDSLLTQLNDPEALTEQGFRLRNGRGALRNEALGWELTVKAALAKHPIAQAACYYQGRFVSQDYRRACELYEKSGSLGHPSGTFCEKYYSLC